MLGLLDYPKEDIITRSTNVGKIPTKIVEDFYHHLRRHEKLCYDSFESLSVIDSEERTKIRKTLLEQVLDSGWGEYLKKYGSEKNPNKILARYELGLDLSNTRVDLVTKSTSQESKHLKSVLNQSDIATKEMTIHTNDEVIAARKIEGQFAKMILKRRAEGVESKGGELEP